MMESRRPLGSWRPGDDLESARFNAMQELILRGQLMSSGKNVRLTGTPGGNTCIAVDPSQQTFTDFYGIFAISGATQDGSDWRWTYTMVEQEKSAAGYEGWTTVSGGETITAHNYAEEDNGASGLMGNGVEVDSGGLIPGTAVSIKPIPTAKGVHRVYQVQALSGEVEYWFRADNAMDGECE
jgi:hypothetical protein